MCHYYHVGKNKLKCAKKAKDKVKVDKITVICKIMILKRQ